MTAKYIAEDGDSRFISLFWVENKHMNGLFFSRYQIWLPRDPPPPPPKSLDDAPILPLSTANFLSMMTYHWIAPILKLGFQRPLQATDLWRMDPSREAEHLRSRLDEAWSRRVARAKGRNARLAEGEITPSVVRRSWWVIKSIAGGTSLAKQEERWRLVDGREDPSLVMALNDVLGVSFWAGGAHSSSRTILLVNL